MFSDCIVLMSPWFAPIDGFPIDFEPLSHISEPFLENGINSSVGSRPDIKQKISATTEHKRSSDQNMFKKGTPSHSFNT